MKEAIRISRLQIALYRDKGGYSIYAAKIVNCPEIFYMAMFVDELSVGDKICLDETPYLVDGIQNLPSYDDDIAVLRPLIRL